jgi:hypothetical protein
MVDGSMSIQRDKVSGVENDSDRQCALLNLVVGMVPVGLLLSAQYTEVVATQ